MTFKAWFNTITGQAPYPYQEVLATAPELPDILSVPTGAGKTAAAVLGWLWRRRMASPQVRGRTPRRLVFCLPMRTLVDQTFRCAEAWLERAGLTREVGLHRLLGGVPRSERDAWDAAPEADAILIGTQDMLLSRALCRGYGASRYRWPWHFALLNSDCLWVIDEVQLMGPGLTTSAQLQFLREAIRVAMPAHTLWMSATLSEGRLETVDKRRRLSSVGLADEDRGDARLAHRLGARKALAASRIAVAKGKDASEALAAEVWATHRIGSLTLVVVNNVARAQGLYRALRGHKAARAEVPVELLHARFRRREREALSRRLLDPQAPFSGILVSTQAIEAGVDISARVLFTEVASWSSIVQRLGRCNRAGEFTDAQVRWIDLADDEQLALPYTREALAEARRHLRELKDAGPDALSAIPQPSGEPEPPVLRRRDLEGLFDTEPDLAGHDIDISPYVRDADEADVLVAWRAWEDEPDDRALGEDELCRVRVTALRDFLGRSGAEALRWSGVEGCWERIPARRVVPGMTLLLPLARGGYSEELGFTGDKADVPREVPAASRASEDSDPADELSRGCDAYVTLAVHAQDSAEAMQALQAAIGGEHPWADLIRAARWHDLGKVHPAFQDMLIKGLPRDDPQRSGGPWAKSDRQGGRNTMRPGYRHELASALSYLAQGGDDLGAYVIAAHHGKVRTAIRAGRDEVGDPAQPERRFARGVWDGEVLPGADLGEGEVAASTALDLRLMELGEGPTGPSWQARVLGLVARYGVFRLAYYEALVRAADLRATLRRKGGG